MKKMTSTEMRAINGGAYKCTTKVTKKTIWGYRSVQCGFKSGSKTIMGYHFLFAHNAKNCTYTVV